MLLSQSISFFFFFNDTATTEIYTLSLHDALPIFERLRLFRAIALRGQIKLGLGNPFHLKTGVRGLRQIQAAHQQSGGKDRKSTRLNSSHSQISYAVFCLKKKK